MEEAKELEASDVVIKEKGEDNDAMMLNAIENAIWVTEAEEKGTAEDENLDVGTSLEQTFSTGMAPTLNILWQQGFLAMPTADQTDCEHVQL
jgi:U4/U6.U5 tri-snRNP-associated protein 1